MVGSDWKNKTIRVNQVIYGDLTLLPFKALTYFCTNHGNQRVFSI